MSLLNLRNLAAPFTDRRNMVTIVLCAALFGAVRLAGGKVEARPQGIRTRGDVGRLAPLPAQTQRSTAAIVDTARDQVEEEEFDLAAPLDIGQEIRRSGGQPTRVTQPDIDTDIDDPFASAIKLERELPAAGKDQRNARPAQAGKHFEDIERSLGIR